MRYLANLGYDGESPLSMAEASAALDEMLSSGDSSEAHRQILAERRERSVLFSDGQGAGGSRHLARTPNYLLAPLYMVADLAGATLWTFNGLAAGTFWMLSRIIGAVGWIVLRTVGSIVWILSRLGILAGRSATIAVQAGRDKVIPWIGARDWSDDGERLPHTDRFRR